MGSNYPYPLILCVTIFVGWAIHQANATYSLTVEFNSGSSHQVVRPGAFQDIGVQCVSPPVTLDGSEQASAYVSFNGSTFPAIPCHAPTVPPTFTCDQFIPDQFGVYTVRCEGSTGDGPLLPGVEVDYHVAESPVLGSGPDCPSGYYIDGRKSHNCTCVLKSTPSDLFVLSWSSGNYTTSSSGTSVTVTMHGTTYQSIFSTACMIHVGTTLVGMRNWSGSFITAPSQMNLTLDAPVQADVSDTPANITVECEANQDNAGDYTFAVILTDTDGVVTKKFYPRSTPNVSHSLVPPLDSRERLMLANYTIACRATSLHNENAYVEESVTLESPVGEVSGCNATEPSGNCSCRLTADGIPQGSVRWVDVDNNTISDGVTEAVYQFFDDDTERVLCQIITLGVVVQQIPFQHSAPLGNITLDFGTQEHYQVMWSTGGVDMLIQCLMPRDTLSGTEMISASVSFNGSPPDTLVCSGNTSSTGDDRRFNCSSFVPMEAGVYNVTCQANRDALQVVSDTVPYLVMTRPFHGLGPDCPQSDYLRGRVPFNCSCIHTSPHFDLFKVIWNSGDYITKESGSTATLIYDGTSDVRTLNSSCLLELESDTYSTKQYSVEFNAPPTTVHMSYNDSDPMETPNGLQNITISCRMGLDYIGDQESYMYVRDANGSLVVDKDFGSNMYAFTYSFPPTLDVDGNLTLDNQTVTCRAAAGNFSDYYTENSTRLANPVGELSGCDGIDIMEASRNCTCRLKVPGVPGGFVRWVNASNDLIVSAYDEAVFTHARGDTDIRICQIITLGVVVQSIPFQPFNKRLPSVLIEEYPVYDNTSSPSDRFLVATQIPLMYVCNLTDPGMPSDQTTVQWMDLGTGDIISTGKSLAILNFTGDYWESEKDFRCSASNAAGVSEVTPTLYLKFYTLSPWVQIQLEGPTGPSSNPITLTVVCKYDTRINPSFSLKILVFDSLGNLTLDFEDTNSWTYPETGIARLPYNLPIQTDGSGKPLLDFNVTCRAQNSAGHWLYTDDTAFLESPIVELSGCPEILTGSIHTVPYSGMNPSTNCTCRLTRVGNPPGLVRWINSQGNTLVDGSQQAVLELDKHDHLEPFTCQALAMWTVVEEFPFAARFSVPPEDSPRISITLDGGDVTDITNDVTIDVVQGEVLSIRCEVEGGFPRVENVTVTYGDEVETFTGTEVSINRTIHKLHNGHQVTCTAFHETGMYDKQTRFSINVQLPASVQSMTINDQSSNRVEVRVGSPVGFACRVEGNPPPTVQIKGLYSGVFLDVSTNATSVVGGLVTSLIPAISVLNTDVYVCTAVNTIPTRRRGKRCAEEVPEMDTQKTGTLIVLGVPTTTYSEDDPPVAKSRSDGRLLAEVEIIANPKPISYSLVKVTERGVDMDPTHTEIPRDQFVVELEEVNCRISIVKLFAVDINVDNTRYKFSIDNGEGPPTVIYLGVTPDTDSDDRFSRPHADYHHNFFLMVTFGVMAALGFLAVVVMVLVFLYWLREGKGRLVKSQMKSIQKNRQGFFYTQH